MQHVTENETSFLVTTNRGRVCTSRFKSPEFSYLHIYCEKFFYAVRMITNNKIKLIRKLDYVADNNLSVMCFSECLRTP